MDGTPCPEGHTDTVYQWADKPPAAYSIARKFVRHAFWCRTCETRFFINEDA